MATSSDIGESDRLALLQAENERLRQELAKAQAAGGAAAREAQFHTIADSIDQMIWTALPDGHHDYFNRRWYEFTGTTEGSTDGEGWNGMFHPDDRERAWAVWRHCLATGEPYHIEYRLRHRSGDYRWVLGRARPVLDEAGEIVRWYGTCTDIHDVKTARDALSASRTRLAAFMENTPDALFIKDAEGRYVLVNQSFLARTGRAEDEVIGRTDVDIFGPELGAQFMAEDEELRRAGAPRRFEENFEYGGRQLAALTQKFPLPDGQIGCITTDITDRKQAEAALRETSRRLDSILNNTRMAIFMMDERQHCAFMNKAAEELTGYTFEETQGRPLHDVIHHKYPDGRHYPLHECPIDRAFPEDDQVEGEELFVHKDGHFYPVGFTASPIRNDAGRPIGTIIEARNIAAEKARDEALREESHALETLNQTAARVAAEFDLDKLVQTVVDGGVELTGAQFGAFFYNVLDEQGASYMLYALSGADRSAFDNYPMPRATKVFAPTFRGEGVIRSDDIQADPRYGKNPPYNGMPEGHLPVRSYLSVPVVSRSGEVIGGLFFGHGERGVFSARSERLMKGLSAQAAIGIDNARLFNAVQQANRRLEAQVEERTADRDRMWRLSTDVMLVANFESEIVATNPAWTTVLGWGEDELLGKPFLDLVHPDDIAATLAEVGGLAEGRRTLRFENRYRHKDGAYRWLSWTAVPDAGLIHAVGRDVTAEKQAAAELEQAQEALRQAQKMETLGQLTGGVAHDFNNLLQIVTGNLEILQRNLPKEEARLRRSAENAMKGAERASILTQRLLAFSRRQPLEPKPINLNKLVGGMSELLHRTLGETIEVETVLASGLWNVEADPNQLENAILNLAVNARDAMPGGGKLTIETANTHLDRGYAAQNSGVSPGQYVVVCVSDTGSGMDEETLERVFEPFFTTKDVGKGTGLGLSMVYGFVKQSGGHVKIYSEPGEGTTVKIYLPRLRGDLVEEENNAEALIPEGTSNETILVCEDDDDVRAYSVEVLRELGYRVLEAHDGPSALRLLERQEGRVDLLFTDVVLPSGMMGNILADQARAVRPGLKVLFTTGYARNAIVHHGRLDPGVELITKPFSYAELAARIRDLLDAAS